MGWHTFYPLFRQGIRAGTKNDVFHDLSSWKTPRKNNKDRKKDTAHAGTIAPNIDRDTVFHFRIRN